MRQRCLRDSQRSATQPVTAPVDSETRGSCQFHGRREKAVLFPHEPSIDQGVDVRASRGLRRQGLSISLRADDGGKMNGLPI